MVQIGLLAEVKRLDKTKIGTYDTSGGQLLVRMNLKFWVSLMIPIELLKVCKGT